MKLFGSAILLAILLVTSVSAQDTKDITSEYREDDARHVGVAILPGDTIRRRCDQ